MIHKILINIFINQLFNFKPKFFFVVITGVTVSNMTLANCVNNNLNITCEGDITLSGPSFGYLYSIGNLNGLFVKNNANITWDNAQYGSPNSSSSGTRAAINYYTSGVSGKVLKAINTGSIIVNNTSNLPSNRGLATMGLYTPTSDSFIEWENTGLLQISSNSNASSGISGVALQARGQVDALNSGTIISQQFGGSTSWLEGLEIKILGLTSDTARDFTLSTFTNKGNINISGPSSASGALGVSLIQKSQNYNSLPSYFILNNDGDITVDVTNTNSTVVNLNSNNFSNVFYEINNNGKLLATDKNYSAILHRATNTNQSSNVVLNNTGIIVGKITTNSGSDKITQTSGSIDGDIFLGAGNDSMLASGGKLNSSIFMGDDNDHVTFKDTLNVIGVPQVDGGLGQDTFNVEAMSLRGFTAASNDNTGNSIEKNNINLTNFEVININNSAQFELTNNLFTDSNKGTLNLANNSTLSTNQNINIADNLFIHGNVNNDQSLINLSDNTLSDSLTITGDYSGNRGVVSINTELNDDSSKTDKLIVNGSAKGSTELRVKNAGGTGAQTINGIHVIQTGSSENNATFILQGGAVSIGAYDYRLNLKKAGTGTNTTAFDNWYLESKLKQRDIEVPVYTPDVGEYLAVETMGNTLFTSRLEDREGASQYQNLGQNDKGNVWVRAYGGHHQFKSMQDQLKTKGNSFVTQIGAGLVTLGEEDQFNLGAMGGFAYYDGKTRSSLTSRESKTKMDGYSLGLYGTWYAYPVEKRGAYIDSWVLWNKFNNKIDTPNQNQYKYDSSGVTASIEAGGDYLINKNGKKDWWIQPQAQLIYQGVHADDFKDAQGVDIYHGKDNVQARMGVKTYLNIPTDGNKLTSYRPYVALNFIHNTNPYSVVIDDVRYENEGSANLGELKLGVEGQVTKNSQVWLNASYVAGSHSNQAYQGNIGWKYNF